MNTVYVLLLSVFFVANGHSAKINGTLQQVHVLFRHGDRTPSKLSLYPKDPYRNETYYPYGLGHLTNIGKKQMINLGRTLRKRYGTLLGDVYSSYYLDVTTSDTYRAKMSALSLVAGLFPPNKVQRFDDDLNWQPIPYNYEPYKKDKLLGGPITSGCKEYKSEYQKSRTSSEVKQYFEDNAETIQYIRDNSGKNVTTLFDLYNMYLGLYMEETLGKKLPSWTTKVYPEFLKSAVLYEYEIENANALMIQHSGGRLVKKLIADGKKKAKKPTKGKRMYLYSGHDYNLVNALVALKVFDKEIPKYASYIAFELHQVNNTPGFKIYYQNYNTDDSSPRAITIPGCSEFCSIEQMETILEDHIPTFEKCEKQNS